MGDLNAEGGRRLMAKTPIDADIWRNPFGDDLVPYYQGSCKLVSDDEWAGNVSLFQDLRYTEDGGYKPISISAAIRELDDESYCIGVFDSDPNTASQHPNELMNFGRFMPNCENWIQAFGVYADYKHDGTSMMKLDGSYIGIRDTKTHSFVASCQFRVEAKTLRTSKAGSTEDPHPTRPKTKTVTDLRTGSEHLISARACYEN